MNNIVKNWAAHSRPRTANYMSERRVRVSDEHSQQYHISIFTIFTSYGEYGRVWHSSNMPYQQTVALLSHTQSIRVGAGISTKSQSFAVQFLWGHCQTTLMSNSVRSRIHSINGMQRDFEHSNRRNYDGYHRRVSKTNYFDALANTIAHMSMGCTRARQRDWFKSVSNGTKIGCAEMCLKIKSHHLI